jgi:AmiR/NasT family two-component response regulator
MNDERDIRLLVDQAKAILIDRHGISERDALTFIQRTAADRRVRVREVVQEIIVGFING